MVAESKRLKPFTNCQNHTSKRFYFSMCTDKLKDINSFAEKPKCTQSEANGMFDTIDYEKIYTDDDLKALGFTEEDLQYTRVYSVSIMELFEAEDL
jgi:hypothetical protein